MYAPNLIVSQQYHADTEGRYAVFFIFLTFCIVMLLPSAAMAMEEKQQSIPYMAAGRSFPAPSLCAIGRIPPAR